MAIKDYAKFAKDVLELVGGSNNVKTATNCMTRLRLVLNDTTKLKETELKKLSGVLQVITDGNIIQVVLGPGVVKKVADEFTKLLDDKKVTNIKNTKLSTNASWRENKAKIKEKQSRFGWFSRGIKHLANIFSPIIPAIIAAGLFAALESIVKQFGAGGNIDTATQAVKIFFYLFRAFNTGFTSYVCLAIGYNAAKEFGATPMLGLMIGGIGLVSEINDLAKQIGLWNIDHPLASVLRAGKGGVIGVILAVLLLSVVEKFLHKKMPNVLDNVFTPFISILVVGCVYVFGIMIVAGYISDGIVWVIGKLTLNSNVIVRMIVGFLAAALFLPLVMTGMHHGLVAFYEIEKAQAGHNFISLYPALAMAGAGQVGAAIALYIKARRKKNNQLMQNISGSIVPGIFGVGEPLIYSVTLPLGTPFFTAGLGAGIGGAFALAFQIGSTAYGPSGLVAIPLMVYFKGQPNALMGMLFYTLGLLISAASGFLFTYFFIKDKKVAPSEN